MLAVNRQLSEADPTPLAPEKIRAAVETAVDDVSAVHAAIFDDGQTAEKEDWFLWWYALAATGALLLAELWIGNKTLRH
jgi:hypothetical protein